MKRYTVNCELLDEVVLSERGATAGAHRSLDYLPGAAFLGAAAARIYAQISEADAFTVFHSGRVRFCNALPLSDGLLALPVPLCLHERKNEPAGRDAPDVARLFNFVHEEARDVCRADGGQPRQLRAAWLTDIGKMIRPARGYRMKTAVEATTGRAAEGQLFGYESLLPGTRFAGEIQFDDDVPETLCRSVLDSLGGTLRLGRSRSAQYGRVRCALAPASTSVAPARKAQRLVLWLISDLAASRDGVPTFSPEPRDLGLSAPGMLDAAASFIRTRRYTPYNTHRRLPDLERQVIVAGSVLVYRLDTPLSEGDYADLTAGLGDGRESGLGQVSVNPPLLTDLPIQFRSATTKAPDGAAIATPVHALARWLASASRGADADSALKDWVERMVGEWARRQESARRFAGLRTFDAGGPTRTQWGVVQGAAKNARTDRRVLEAALFGEAHGICRGADDWERPLGPGWEESDLRDWLKARVGDKEASANAGLVIARLAGAIQKTLGEKSYRELIKEAGRAN